MVTLIQGVIGVCVFGFLVFKVISRVIYGFWGWIYECEVMQGLLWVFGGTSGSFFRGLECSLYL